MKRRHRTLPVDFTTLLPSKLVNIRQANGSDLKKLVRWVDLGRRETVFQAGSRLTPASVRSYQKSNNQQGWTYKCFIVQDGKQPIGYIDFRYHTSRGEILGIFLEPDYRFKRIGSHLFRYAIAYLQECGCRKIKVEVYAENLPSLRACYSAGFSESLNHTRFEDGKLVRILERSVLPFPRIMPAYIAYRSLKGENHFLHHVAIADALVSELKKINSVQMILGLGSLSRGFADEWSDIDLAVLGQGPSLALVRPGERWFSNYSIDIFVVDLLRDPPAKWDDSRRQVFEESVILFSRENPARKILDSIKLGKRERRQKIHETLLKLGWIGFQPKTWYNKVKYGYNWILPPDLWLRRGSISSAHATVDQALDLAFQLLFLINFRHVPDPKWRRYLVSELPWLPKGFDATLAKSEVKSLTKKSFEDRAGAVLLLIEQLVRHLEQSRLLGRDIYKAYLNSSSDYNPYAQTR